MSARPPRVAEWLLSALLPAADREEVLGDLQERFLGRSKGSHAGASLWYWRQVLGCVPRLAWFRVRPRAAAVGRARVLPVPEASRLSLVALLSDVRHALRIVVREPAFSATAALILSLGVGATTTMFSISHGVLKDMPLVEAERVVHVGRDDVASGRLLGLPPEDIIALQAEQTVLEGLAAYDEVMFQLAGDEGPPERRSGAMISPQTFPLLRVPVRLGRGLVAADAQPGAPPVVVVGEPLWRDRWGGQADVLGSLVRVDGVQRTVVGVMAGEIAFPIDQQLWIPLSIGPTRQADDETSYHTFGRLRDGVGMEEARTQLSGIGGRLQRARAETGPSVRFAVRPFTDQLIDADGRTMMLTMVLAVSFVLLIASANVANLLLSRAVVRSKEIAVRMALGGGRIRVMTLLLAESLVLAVLGGLGGLALSFGAVGWFERVLGPEVDAWWIVFEVDRTALVFALVCVAGATLVAGVAPALQASNVDLQDAIKSESHGNTGFRQGRASRVLVVGQLALTCALLILSGLMVRGVVRLEAAERGFEPTGVLTGRVDLEEFDYPDDASRRVFSEELQGRLGVIPGVDEVAFLSSLPGRDAATLQFGLDDAVDLDGPARPSVETRWVTPSFFDFSRMTLRQGRLFDASDRDGVERVVVVNEAMAARLAPGGSAVGLRLFLGHTPTVDDGVRIVGVVDDADVSVRLGDRFAGIFLPFWELPWRTVRLAVRTQREAGALAAAVREVLRDLDPNLPFHEVETLESALDRVFLPQRTFGILFAVFGLSGLLLAAVGLYGVIAFSVNRRSREIGVRRALGASPGDILWRTFKDGLTPVVLGLALGLGLGLLLAPSLGEALFGSDPQDPVVFGLIPVLLMAVAGLGLWIPSRRASKVDPMAALRSE
jgi:predicted permease